MCYVLYVKCRALSLIMYQTYSDLFLSYLNIFSHIVAFLEPFVTLTYSGSCHVNNPSIFRTKIYSKLCQGIFRHTQNAVYHLHIGNPVIFRTLPYSKSCLFKCNHAYPDIFDSDSLVTFASFFHFNLTYFSTMFGKTCLMMSTSILA